MKAFFRLSAGLALQALLDIFSQLVREGKATQAQAVQLIGICGGLRVNPVSLLAYLDGPGCFDWHATGWTEVRLLLVAFRNLELGRHHSEDQKGMPQPWRLIDGLVRTALRLCRAGSLPSAPDHSRSIRQALAYIADRSDNSLDLVKRLARHAGEFDAGSNSMNKLYRAVLWLQERLGVQLPSSVNWCRLQKTCAGPGRPHVMAPHQRQMQEALAEIGRDDRRIGFLSQCEYSVPGVGISADVFVRTRRGFRIVFEFDGDGHFVGPYGSLNGTTLWRNGMLRHLRYKLISVSEEEWACSSNRQERQDGQVPLNGSCALQSCGNPRHLFAPCFTLVHGLGWRTALLGWPVWRALSVCCRCLRQCGRLRRCWC